MEIIEKYYLIYLEKNYSIKMENNSVRNSLILFQVYLKKNIMIRMVIELMEYTRKMNQKIKMKMKIYMMKMDIN
jgi:hypothetical protein